MAGVRKQIYGLHQPEGRRSHAVCVTHYEVVAHAEQKLIGDAALAMRYVSRSIYYVCECVAMEMVIRPSRLFVQSKLRRNQSFNSPWQRNVLKIAQRF